MSTAVNSGHSPVSAYERRAILTRAAMCEAERQRARERHDWPTLAAAEDELRRLWARHAELEAAERVA